MPPKKDGVETKEGQKKARKKRKVIKKKDECPSRLRKTDRVVLNSQARDIIAKVYDFMKKEAMDEYAEKLTNARWRTATAAGVSEKTVSRILRDRNIKKAGSAAGSIAAVAGGKLNAVADVGAAFGDVLSGNFTGAGHNVAGALGSVVAGDTAGLAIAASGIANATGQIVGAKLHTANQLASTVGKAAGQVVAGKVGLVKNIGAGVGELASGNVSGALDSLGNAAGSMIAGDTAAINTLASGSLGAFFDR
ncbi:uncharacterized protein LOC126376691 [Pectinophora gossypiella]|uniref:Uncharacterized protein n=1 Tax=Pectinophora gossypiella TaxID=13191 RepID=A0A1E1WTV2_PECGO|nr:uncharacterized protein LOC126376691 [Pectinophora gossypiella]